MAATWDSFGPSCRGKFYRLTGYLLIFGQSAGCMGKLFSANRLGTEIRPKKFGPDFGPKTGFGFTAAIELRPVGGVGGGKDWKLLR